MALLKLTSVYIINENISVNNNHISVTVGTTDQKILLLRFFLNSSNNGTIEIFTP